MALYHVALYIEDSGTSMAAPHVSGPVAAFLSVRPELIGQPERIKSVFCRTAISLGREHYFQGAGLVDLIRALQSFSTHSAGGGDVLRIAGLPFGEVTFDAEGHADSAALGRTLADPRAEGVTDVLVFSHGWNNSRDTADRLYDRFLGLFRPLLQNRLAADRTGLLGVYWPSRRWSDEPEPDFDVGRLPDLRSGFDGASLVDLLPSFPLPPSPDDETRDTMREAFPESVGDVDELVDLLRRRPARLTVP